MTVSVLGGTPPQQRHGRDVRPGTVLAKYVDPLPRPATVRPDAAGRLRIRMLATDVRLHSQLPPSRVWTYEGSLPGPTIEVRSGQPVDVEWVDDLDGDYPVTEVVGPAGSENHPGRSGRTPDPRVAALTPWNVVHVHGSSVPGSSDGWTENALLPGQSTVGTYPNDQRAMALWYHDHGMGVTRLNVVAGLAGMWLVRDGEEDALGLPSGDFEIPLLLQDRNLDTDEQGRLTGRLLHKVEDGTAEFFGPYTLVNGAIWPYLDVEPRQYRLRVLNGSNARTYRLVLLDEHGADVTDEVTDVVRQIGTDGGLLGAAVPLPPGGLVLAPAERADLVVDFRALRGRRLRWVNTATAPFRGEPLPEGTKPGDVDRAGKLVEPDVLQFRVADVDVDDTFTMPEVLSNTYRRTTHDDLPHDHPHRLVALVERDGVLQLCETAPLGTMRPPAPMGAMLPGGNPLAGQVLPVKEPHRPTTYHVILATRFDETVNWHVRLGDWEVWKILNLTEDTHPFHVHLVQFQALRRDVYDVTAWNADTGRATGVLRYEKPGVLEANETGDKDTIRVNPGEMVAIAARFDGGTGRYMYHCHILEHEDHDMMRPFVVAPPAVLDLMDMPGMDGMHGM